MHATTIAFTLLVLYEMFNVFNFRSESSPIFKANILNNRYLILAVISSILLQVLVIYTPLRNIFKTVPLAFNEWLALILVSSSVLIIIEILKFLFRTYSKNKIAN